MSFAFKRLADYWNPQTNPVKCRSARQRLCWLQKHCIFTRGKFLELAFVPVQARWTLRRQLYRKTIELHISRTSLAWDNISAAPFDSCDIAAREWLMRHSTLSCLIRWEFERQTSALWQFFSLFYRKSRKFNNKAIFPHGVWSWLKIATKKNSWARFWLDLKSCLRVSRARGLRFSGKRRTANIFISWTPSTWEEQKSHTCQRTLTDASTLRPNFRSRWHRFTIECR